MTDSPLPRKAARRATARHRTLREPMRSARTILLAGLCGLALADAAPAATTEIGRVAPAGAIGSACGACSYVQVANGAGSPSYVVPAGGGVITQWSVRGGRTIGGGDLVGLRVFRPGAPSGGYFVVADSPAARPRALDAGWFRARIPVQGGEVLGLRLSTAGDTAAFSGGAGEDVVGDVVGDPEPGADSGVVVENGGRRVNVAVRLESDNDGDGLGDDTQDIDDDNDDASDAAERKFHTDPLNPDTDGDGAAGRLGPLPAHRRREPGRLRPRRRAATPATATTTTTASATTPSVCWAPPPTTRTPTTTASPTAWRRGSAPTRFASTATATG